MSFPAFHFVSEKIAMRCRVWFFFSLPLAAALLLPAWSQTAAAKSCDAGANLQGVMTISRAQASLFAKMAMGAISREYPNKPEHYLIHAADVKGPRACTRPSLGRSIGTLRSTAIGCWCGCCDVSRSARAEEIRAVLGKHLTAKNLKAEADYFAQPTARRSSGPTAGPGC